MTLSWRELKSLGGMFSVGLEREARQKVQRKFLAPLKDSNIPYLLSQSRPHSSCYDENQVNCND